MRNNGVYKKRGNNILRHRPCAFHKQSSLSVPMSLSFFCWFFWIRHANEAKASSSLAAALHCFALSATVRKWSEVRRDGSKQIHTHTHKKQCLALKQCSVNYIPAVRHTHTHTHTHTQSYHCSLNNAGVSCSDMMNHVVFLSSFQLGFL